MFWGNFYNSKPNKGFSITEMSVVLLSVAAIIVTVAGSVTILNNTKLRNITADISTFSSAISEFENQYGALPGDIADTSSLSGATPGNGNGVIDTDAEALNVWRHLSLSGLITGSYDGSSTNSPGVGVPASDIEAGGYNIRQADTINSLYNVSEEALVIELASFSNSSNSLEILTPQDARSIDERADDGEPTTGLIIAEGTGCLSGNSYNVSQNSASCRLLFIVKKGALIDDAPDIDGTCVDIGQTRQLSDSSITCQPGYTGKIIQTCRVSSGNNEGQWEITDRNCSEVQCSGGGNYGETRTLSCVNDMVGTGIVQRCGEGGVWEFQSSDCAIKTSVSCGVDGSIRPKAQACDLGESGYMIQACDQFKWGTPTTNTCTATQCSGLDIGKVRTELVSTCDDDENEGEYIGLAAEVCSVDGNWHKTSIGSSCVPVYGTCPTDGDTRTIGCPTGMEGQHTQICVGATTNYWTTLSDTCEPIQCSGGKNIGDYRVKEGVKCPKNKNGLVMEYCDATGNWVETTENCVSDVCEQPNDFAGNAYWPTSEGGAFPNPEATGCIEGYEEQASPPTRVCNPDGSWGVVSSQCVRMQCDFDYTPAEDIGFATYPNPTYAGENNAIGTCIAGYVAQSPNYPQLDCKEDGTWDFDSLELPCVNSCPKYELSDLGASGVAAWWDAADECKVWASSDCTSTEQTPGGGNIGCIEDKSGNDFNATQSTGSSQPTYTTEAAGKNNLPTMQFDGSSDKLLFPDIGAFSTTTAFAVHKEDAYPSGGSCIMCGYNNDPASEIYFSSSTTGILQNRAGDRIPKKPSSDNPYTSGQYNITIANDDNTDVVTYKNGDYVASETITTPVDNTWGPGVIGSYYWPSSYSYYYDGNIGEIIIFNKDLTTNERESVQTYLGDKWAISYNSLFENAEFWIDASDTSTVYRDSGCSSSATPGSHTVGCITDKSGNDYHATQSSSSNEPTYTSAASGQNNLPTLQFNGSSQRLNFPDIGEFERTTVFAVHKEDSYSTSGQNILAPNGWASKDTFLYYEVGSTRLMMLWVEGRSPTTVEKTYYTTAGIYNITSAYDNNEKTELFQNGLSVASENISTPENKEWGPGTIGGWYYSGSYTMHYDGNIGEVIIFDDALSVEDRTHVETYLSDKWGIALFDVSDLINTSILWLDASDSSTVWQSSSCSTAANSNGDPVGCWQDKSGQGNHALQSNSTKKPAVETNAMGASGTLPVVDFNLSDQDNLYINSSGNDFDFTNNASYLFVMKFDSLGHDRGSFFAKGYSAAEPFDIGTFNDSSRRLYYDYGDGSSFSYLEGSTGSLSTGTDYIISIITSGVHDSHTSWINGSFDSSSADSQSPSGDPSDNVFIGHYDGTSGDEGFDGEMAEIIIFDKGLVSSERESIETYFNDKWGIY
jgi:hypothetical protein